MEQEREKIIMPYQREQLPAHAPTLEDRFPPGVIDAYNEIARKYPPGTNIEKEALEHIKERTGIDLPHSRRPADRGDHRYE
jgi:hypothetical protein